MSQPFKAQLAAVRDQLFPRKEAGCFGKRRYDSMALAQFALRDRQKEVEHELRVYHCGSCDGWHLTKHPQCPSPK